MKGFFALSLALALCALIIAQRNAAYEDEVQQQFFQDLHDAIEERLFKEVQAKALLRQALESAQGSTREERLLSAAASTAKVARFYREHGVQAWMGSPSRSELENMLEESAKSGIARSCDTCIALDFQVNGTPGALALLDERDGRIFVSRNGFAHLALALGNSPSIGFTFAERNLSFAAIAEEGFP